MGGEWGGFPLPNLLGAWGRVVVFLSGVRGGAPAENGFWCMLSFKKPICFQENLVFLTLLRCVGVTSDPKTNKHAQLGALKTLSWGVEPPTLRQLPHCATVR